MRRPSALALALAAFVAAGCEVTPSRDSLSAIRRVAVVEPPAIEVVAQVGADPALPMLRRTGVAPVYMPPGSSRTAGVVGAVVTGALDAHAAGLGSQATRRLHAGCPDHAEKARALRSAIADAMGQSLAGRVQVVRVAREDVAALAAEGAPSPADVDAYIVPNLVSAFWAGSALLDYRPQTAGRLLLVAPDGKTVIGSREVYARDRQGPTYANADELVRRCDEALASLKIAPPIVARAAQELLGITPQEKP